MSSYKNNMLRFIPKSKEIENVFDRLMRYPNTIVKPKVAQRVSRHKKIRYLKELNGIYIRKGLIGLPENVKIKRNGKGFDFFFK